MRRTFLASLAVLAGVSGVLTATNASANSRFPESNQLLFPANDPELVFLRVTFGLLVSHDRGKTFDWVCEKSIGFSGVEDPMYAVTPSNVWVGSTFSGLTVSRDQACNWSFAPEVDGGVLIDLAGNPTDAKNIVAFDSAYDRQDDAGRVFFRSRVWETKDEAQTWSLLGTTLESTLLGYTIDVTRPDPNRIYLTAIRNPGTPTGVVVVSRNRGQTWEEEPVPFENGERSIFIAGVDPNDSEKVYLRTLNNVDKPTRLILREAVDGGQPTYRTIFNAQAGLLGFVLTPDGSRLYIGGPRDGIHSASTTDYVFDKRSTLETQCLGLNPDGLWACSTERAGFILGLSKDEGRNFESRLHFCEIRGPVGCPTGSVTNTECAQAWPAQRAALGCLQDDGGTDAGPPSAPPPKDDGGCGCHAAPAGPWGALVAIAGAAVALVRRARRRRTP